MCTFCSVAHGPRLLLVGDDVHGNKRCLSGAVSNLSQELSKGNLQFEGASGDCHFKGMQSQDTSFFIFKIDCCSIKFKTAAVQTHVSVEASHGAVNVLERSRQLDAAFESETQQCCCAR
jgi:hypothetical protein